MASDIQEEAGRAAVLSDALSFGENEGSKRYRIGGTLKSNATMVHRLFRKTQYCKYYYGF